MSPTTNVPGSLRRRIILSANANTVLAAVEDDFHHFVVTLTHDQTRVTDVLGVEKRAPWATCVKSSAMLQQLVGVLLSTEVYSATRHVDPHEQCTHQYDLALMAIAQAMRGGRKQYDIEVSDAVDGVSQARVWRNKQLCLDWQIQGVTVLTPVEFAGTSLRKLNLSEMATLDAEQAEAVGAMRRVLMMAGGRLIDFDQFEDAQVFAERMSGACYSFQPARMMLAKRQKGSVRNYSAQPELLLKEFPKSGSDI